FEVVGAALLKVNLANPTAVALMVAAFVRKIEGLINSMQVEICDGLYGRISTLYVILMSCPRYQWTSIRDYPARIVNF
ncbi:MAG: hypothetical protein KTR27_04875, partial [Leptolyngbyaceae cyanobacterium MAG.088]|nr:hypothetical protein [Leptolyngbyaceae cyanobacterium MAG.088]